jgi:ABC-type branched-subunit amino acid transport system substrate-binding protein
VFVAVVAALAIVCAACGDDDDTAAEATTAAGSATAEANGATTTGAGSTGATDVGTSTAPAPTGEPIMIGTTWPEGTARANNPDAHAAVNAAARAINAKGGVNGRPLQVVYCNGMYDPNQSAVCARQFVSSNVVAITGMYDTNSGANFLPVLEAAGIPIIGITANTHADYTSPIVYPLDAGTSGVFLLDAAALIKAGSTKIAVTHGTSQGSVDVANAAEDGIKKGGAEAVDLPVASAQTDMLPICSQLQSDHVDGVVMNLPQNSTLALLTACHQLGITDIRWAGYPAAFTADAIKQLGPLADGVIYGSGLPPLNSSTTTYPKLADFFNEMQAEEKAGDGDAARVGLEEAALRAWTSVHILADLASQLPADGVTAASVTDALNKATNIDTGLYPPWTPSQAGPSAFPRVSNPFEFAITIKGGEEALLFPDPLNVFP